MLRSLYSLGWILGVPVALAYLLYRSLRQPEYRLHWRERFGHSDPLPPGRRQIWIHAVSVGETVAAASLIRRLAAGDPDTLLLLTHATPTGRATGSDLFRDLGPRLRQSYLPYDLPFAVKRFLKRQRPSCGLIMEAEVWPNLMHAARARSVPMAVVNARLSEKSLRRGLRYRRLIAPAIEAFDLIVAQSAADSERMSRLARPADAVAGNLKFDQPISQAARETGAAWRSRLAPLRVIVAASTRDGEEALILQHWSSRPAVAGAQAADADAAGGHAAKHGDGSSPADSLLVIVPRHPNRFETVAALIAAARPGKPVLRRAALDRPTLVLRQGDVLLGDSMGEMQNWYACADVVVMGGSLLPYGSHNLIEANALGCPVVLGPSVFNFEQAAAESIAAGAAVQVADTAAALRTAAEIAHDPGRRAGMSAAALSFAQAHRGATDRTLAALEPLLQRSLEGRPPATRAADQRGA